MNCQMGWGTQSQVGGLLGLGLGLRLNGGFGGLPPCGGGVWGAGPPINPLPRRFNYKNNNYLIYNDNEK